jgi:hypothetical protein
VFSKKIHNDKNQFEAKKLSIWRVYTATNIEKRFFARKKKCFFTKISRIATFANSSTQFFI